MVECHLAKVDVASPNLVYRSISTKSDLGAFLYVFGFVCLYVYCFVKTNPRMLGR